MRNETLTRGEREMASDFLSHDGTIQSNAARMGYVSFRCDAWSLPDNTAGGTGWHNVYQMRDELMTLEMQTAGREHNAARRAAESLEKELQLAAAETTSYGPCPRCGTYCCGDCEAV